MEVLPRYDFLGSLATQQLINTAIWATQLDDIIIDLGQPKSVYTVQLLDEVVQSPINLTQEKVEF